MYIVVCIVYKNEDTTRRCGKEKCEMGFGFTLTFPSFLFVLFSLVVAIYVVLICWLPYGLEFIHSFYLFSVNVKLKENTESRLGLTLLQERVNK